MCEGEKGAEPECLVQQRQAGKHFTSACAPHRSISIYICAACLCLTIRTLSQPLYIVFISGTLVASLTDRTATSHKFLCWDWAMGYPPPPLSLCISLFILLACFHYFHIRTYCIYIPVSCHRRPVLSHDSLRSVFPHIFRSISLF